MSRRLCKALRQAIEVDLVRVKILRVIVDVKRLVNFLILLLSSFIVNRFILDLRFIMLMNWRRNLDSPEERHALQLVLVVVREMLKLLCNTSDDSKIVESDLHIG